MVKIPVYDGRDTIGTGVEFFRPIGNEAERDMARGFSALSQGLNDLGESMWKVQQRTEKFQTEKAILDFSQKTERDIDKARQNITETGTGFHDANMKRIREESQKVIDALPETQRAEASIRMQRILNDKSDELAKTEVKQGQTYIGEVSKRKIDQLSTNVLNGTWDRTRAVREADDFMNGIGLPGNLHGQMREALVRGVESSVLERLRTTNPAQFHRETQIYTSNSPSAQAGDVQRLIIEHAKAYGVDPVMLLAYARVESNFNPSLGGHGTIRGLFQLTKSERTRVAKLMGVADAESISYDPALQAAAMTILHKEAETRLQANGIPVNPTTLWGHHFLGPGGVLAFMRADPNADAYATYARVAGEGIARKAFSTNGDLLKPGMTVGQVMDKISGRVERAYADVQKYVHKDPAVGDTSKPMQIMGVQFEYMTPKDLAGHATKATASLVKQTEDQIKARRAQSAFAGDESFNVYDPEHRKALDEAAAADGAQQKILSGDAGTMAKYQMMGRRGYLPKEASQAALAMINSPDRQKQVQGYELAASVMRANPTDGLRLSHFGGAMSPEGASNASKIRDYVNLTAHGQIDPAEAARRVSLTHSSDWKIKETDIKSTLEREVKKRSWAEVQKSLKLTADTKDGWIFSGTPGSAPPSKEIERMMEEKYQGYFRFHFMERGDVEIAKANAMADLQRSHHYDRLFYSKPRMMPYPPERNYPSLNPLPEGKSVGDLTAAQLKENFGYIKDQALDISRDVARKRGDKAADKITEVRLIPTGTTRQDVDQNLLPRYILVYKDSKGAQQFVTGEFRANPDLARMRGQQQDSEGRASRPAVAPQQPAAQPKRQPDAQNSRDRFRAQRGDTPPPADRPSGDDTTYSGAP